MMRRRHRQQSSLITGDEGFQHVPVLAMKGRPFGFRDLRHRPDTVR